MGRRIAAVTGFLSFGVFYWHPKLLVPFAGLLAVAGVVYVYPKLIYAVPLTGIAIFAFMERRSQNT